MNNVGLQKICLRDFCLIKSSSRVFAKEYVEKGIPFFRSKDVIDKSLGIFKKYDLYISESRFKELRAISGSPSDGDLLISSVGNRSGQAYVVDGDGDFYFKDGNIIWISEFDGLDPHFLCYFFNSAYGQKMLKSIMIGSAQKAITIDSLRNLEISIPSLSYQKSSKRILRTLDKKIELNQKMNATLEEIAKTLFKSWFIDFDPVRAKVEGRPTGLSKEISDLFPDSFEDSELGEIPKGWHIGNIEDIAEKVSDKYKIEDDWSNEKLIDLSRMPSNSIALSSYGKGDELSTSVCKFQKYDFLFGSIRPYFYKAGICPFDGVSNTSVFILRAKNIFDKEFMYFYSSSEKTFEKSVQYSDGTKMPIIKWIDFKEFQFALPSEELRTNFSSKIRPIVDKIILNIEEQETLTKLRDSLLPKLISGELKIPDAESLIEEASI
jgi:type I restriction enzyme S subunit